MTGDVGAAYRVTDPGAVYVGGDPMSGVVPENGDAVLYVTRKFMNIQVGDDGHIRNTATVTPVKGEESNSSSTEATPVVMGKTRMLSFGVNMHFSCLETGDDGVLRESMSLSDIPTAFELSYEYTDTDGIEYAGTWTYDDATVFLEKINGTDRSVPALTWPILSIKIEDGESIPIKFRQSGYVIDGDTGKFVYKSTTVRDVVTRGNSGKHSQRVWFTDDYKLSDDVWTEPTTYKLEYDANGGKIRSNDDSATTMTHEANSFEDSYTFTVKTAPETSTNFDPTWAGHELLGWADTKDAKEVIYQAGAQIKLDETAPTKTIYAVWEAIAPSKPTDTELYNLKLGVRIVCGVQGSGHKAMGYTLNTPKSVGTAQLKAISDVTANAGDDKDQYPYACTVSISTTQQNNYWLAQNMQGGTPKWNADHKLLDDVQDLAVTLYWNGNAWVDLGAPASGWHYMVIHTTHKPEPESRMKTVTIVKEFIGMKGNKIDADKVPSSFALEYSYTYGGKATDGKLLRSAATAGTNENGHPTLTWKLEVPVDKDMSSASKTPLTVTESGYEVDGYTWTKQSGLNSSDETAVSGTYRIDATGNLPTNYIRNYYTKNPLLELPKTGGTGIAPYIILGSTMALLAVLLLAGREKRR